MTVDPGPDTYDLKDLERTLGEEGETAELGVRLSVTGGRVFVRGVVSSGQQRERVMARVGRACPGLAVVDELGCAEPGLALGPGPAEELR